MAKEAKKILDFLKLNRKTSSSNLSSDVAPKGLDTNAQSNSYVQPTALTTFEIGYKLCDEIRWALKHVLSDCSNNSCQDIVSIFKSMFPDSKIAEKMELAHNKLKYLVNYGLAPYFKECLSDDILKSECFIVCFDESLNATVQECEIDLLVRYWDSIKSRF